MRVSKVAALIVAGIALGGLLSATPADATVIRPTVAGFSSSSTLLYKTGGTITLSALVTNATSCVFSSNKVIAGMPYGVTPCDGLVTHDVTLPVNNGKHPAVYTLKLAATGARTTNAKPSIRVTVGTQLPPPSQSTPTSGTVSSTGSAGFTDQLTAIGGYGAITFGTTVPSAGLSVSPSGAVTTTGALAVGTYTASGTVTDTILAVGTWAYTLTVTPAPPSEAIAIAAGWEHTCALLSGGTVQCWGRNDYGQLGDGTNSGPETCGYGLACSLVPVAVTGLSGATAISAGGDTTCVVVAGGTAACWGRNYFGQLGDGTTIDPNVPVTVSGL